MTLSMIHRRRLALLVIVSLLACAMTPASAAIINAVQSACHSVIDDRSSIEAHDMNKASSSSAHDSAPLDHEHLCDEDPVPLTTDSVQLPMGWWTALSFFVVVLLHQLALHLVWRRGPRRYPPRLRSHLAIGRIQV